MLDLNEVMSHPQVKSIFDSINTIRGNRPQIKGYLEWPEDRGEWGGANYSQDIDTIFIDFNLPIHMAIHEALHVLLIAEDYPDLFLFVPFGPQVLRPHLPD